MNIFGGAVGGLIGMYFYARARKIDGWLLADAGLLGLLIGQAIGRFGNLINQELYGPPTGSTWFGLLIREENRLPQFRSLPAETRFHPTMMYEATWLILTFVILYVIFRRNHETIVHGIMTGAYLIMAGVGRFIMEFWRPDQPTLTLSGGVTVSYSRILSVFYVIIGIVVVLDRMGYMRIPFIGRPQTARQRQQAFAEIQTQRRRKERALEREKVRAQRLKDRGTRAAEDKGSTEDTQVADE
jgi:phosphatidylglycerol:prolipoprotein diacylglycerol transferase